MPGPGISKPRRINFQITIVAGTPQRLVPVDSITGLPSSPSPIWINRIFIQGRANASPGVGLVLAGVPIDVTLNSASAAQLAGEIGASPSATQPGGSYGDPPGSTGGFNMTYPNDLREFGLDATVAGTYLVSYDLRD